MSKINWNTYNTDGFFDEMFNDKQELRHYYSLFKDRLTKMGWRKLNYLQHTTNRAQLSLGMTFNVCNDN